MQSPLLDTAGAAAFLGLAPRTLMNWRIRGGDHPPFIRIGGAIRYAPEDLAAYVAARRVASTSQRKP